nr:hypothetical protein [uncultured Duganella sp.]
MTSNLHPYLRFRASMTRQALLRIIPSLSSSLEIILLGFAPVVIGLLACIALPGLFAATLPWPQALALVLAQVLVATAPVWLMRKHLHPAEVTLWSRALPISPRLRWSADAMVAGIIVGPVAVAFAVSTAIWFYQRPDWLRPVAPAALALTVLSLLLAWLLSTLVLAQRVRMPAARKPGRARPAPTSYVPGEQRIPKPLYQWHRLFWLPFWRADDVVGIQQTLLLLGAMLGVSVWMWHPPLVPPALWGACTALTLMLLTDRGDKAVAEQIARLRPVAAAWPIDAERLFRAAMVLTLLPGLCVLAWFAALALGRAAAGYSTTVAIVWLCFAAIAQIAVVASRGLSARGRTALVIGAILILTAIGSELWN